MSSNYDKFLQVLKKWPVDLSRSNRDYGSYLRKLFKNSKRHEEIFPGSAEENSKKLDALLRLADDKYLKKYPYNKTTGVTGLDLQNLHRALSDKLIKSKTEHKKSTSNDESVIVENHLK